MNTDVNYVESSIQERVMVKGTLLHFWLGFIIGFIFHIISLFLLCIKKLRRNYSFSSGLILGSEIGFAV